jgi:hypothetical protein
MKLNGLEKTILLAVVLMALATCVVRAGTSAWLKEGSIYATTDEALWKAIVAGTDTDLKTLMEMETNHELFGPTKTRKQIIVIGHEDPKWDTGIKFSFSGESKVYWTVEKDQIEYNN